MESIKRNPRDNGNLVDVLIVGVWATHRCIQSPVEIFPHSEANFIQGSASVVGNVEVRKNTMDVQTHFLASRRRTEDADNRDPLYFGPSKVGVPHICP